MYIYVDSRGLYTDKVNITENHIGVQSTAKVRAQMWLTNNHIGVRTCAVDCISLCC